MLKKQILEIKKLIRDWYGTLSVEELMANEKVFDSFKRIEKILQKWKDIKTH